MSERGTLRQVGAIWKPREGAKSLGSGEITVNGLKQRFVIFRNDRKPEGSKAPDYKLMSSDEPVPDDYATRPRGGRDQRAAAKASTDIPDGGIPGGDIPNDDIPW